MAQPLKQRDLIPNTEGTTAAPPPMTEQVSLQTAPVGARNREESCQTPLSTPRWSSVPLHRALDAGHTNPRTSGRKVSGRSLLPVWAQPKLSGTSCKHWSLPGFWSRPQIVSATWGPA